MSIRKQLLLSHSSNSDGDHHVNLNSAAGLRSLLSKSAITASSSCASSTHYAQISPLRGVGVGLPSPTPNYFQVRTTGFFVFTKFKKIIVFFRWWWWWGGGERK